MKTNTITIQRGTYGEIANNAENADLLKTANALILRAVELKLLDAEYFTRLSSTRCEALNYDVYDQSGGAFLIQQRHTTTDKYGSHPTKRYFLIRRVGRGVVVTEVENKATVNRAAKLSVKLGEAIAKAKLGAVITAPITPQQRIKDAVKKAGINAKKTTICVSDARAVHACQSGIKAWCAKAGIDYEAQCVPLAEVIAASVIYPNNYATLAILYAIRRAAA